MVFLRLENKLIVNFSSNKLTGTLQISGNTFVSFDSHEPEM